MLPWTGENADSYRRTRVLVVGPSGSGKSTLCHLIANGSAPEQPLKGTTVGCNAYVKMLRIDNEGRLLPEPPASAGAAPDPQSTCFVELIDVGGHPRYASLRPTFYGNIHGVILVYDATNTRFRSVVSRCEELLKAHGWAQELATRASFMATLPQELAQMNLEGLPVPVLLVANKSDKSGEDEKDGPPRRGRYSLASSLAAVLGPTLWGYLKKVVEVEENFRARVAGRSLLPLSQPHAHRPSHAHSLSRPSHSHSSSFTAAKESSPGTGTPARIDVAGITTTIKGSALKGTMDLASIDDFLASVVARRFHAAALATQGGGTRDLFAAHPSALLQPLPSQTPTVTRRRESPSGGTTQQAMRDAAAAPPSALGSSAALSPYAVSGSGLTSGAILGGSAAAGSTWRPLHVGGPGDAPSHAAGGLGAALHPSHGTAQKSYASARLDEDIDFV